ncbi:MAG TPA: hypothetical protein DC058_11020 [Planctomycetaceae bacterium]|nr:hypothetical protein [Planctomycetaceae bacterium]HBC61735.1 hypothetical protein [Planctomycetaceae bacterium]
MPPSPEQSSDDLKTDRVLSSSAASAGSPLVSIPQVSIDAEYELLESIGRGGMGSLQKARDRSLNRLVVIKRIVDSRNSDPVAQQRFVREAEAHAALEHDNIVRIYRVGRDNKGLFLVLEFVSGEDLYQRIQRTGPVQPAEVLRIAVQICQALQYMHSHGWVHRDLKPANILIDTKGRIRVTDFGIVRPTAMAIQLTETGKTPGTKPYMAPELCNGSGSADERSDLWSLGATLYQLITGQVPPLSKHFDLWDIPELFQLPLSRLLAANPDERFQTAEELLLWLQAEEHAGGSGPTAAPGSAGRTGWKAFAGRTGLLLSLVLLAGCLWFLNAVFSTDPPKVQDERESKAEFIRNTDELRSKLLQE